MKNKSKQITTILLSLFLMNCSSEEIVSKSNTSTVSPVIPATITSPTPTAPIEKTIQYLALGDSYTIGQSVCQTCRYPEQLKARLETIYPETSFSLKTIATTGWTTSNLIASINSQKLESNYDLVTLLIGVNNQFQHQDFSVYKNEFSELVNKAIVLAKGDHKNVIVLSIPDYAYTPYAKSYETARKKEISVEIDQYNKFAENICITKEVRFISITDITRQGLVNTSLVASDGLHPSEIAYTLFVNRMLDQTKIILQD